MDRRQKTNNVCYLELTSSTLTLSGDEPEFTGRRSSGACFASGTAAKRFLA